MDPARTLSRLHAAQQAFYAGGDDGRLREVLCPDIAWHVPGASDIAGTYVGVEAVLAYFARRRDLADRTFRMEPAELLSGDGDHVAMLTHGQATIAGRRHAWSTVGLYRLRGGCVAECRLLTFDQAEFDRIWTRRPDPVPGHPDPAVYDRIGSGYSRHRRPDRRIAAAIHAGLGDARTVVNVGAGAGAYEPTDRCVSAVEPSRAMIAQRPPGSAPVIVGAAAALPLADATVDAAMATLSLHHWPDWRAGVAEMLRVARRRIVVFTWDKGFERPWLTGEYLDWLADWDAERFPTMDELLAELPKPTMTVVPIPRDCTDGFLAAYYARPEAYLDPAVRLVSVMMRIFSLERPGSMALPVDRSAARPRIRPGKRCIEMAHHEGGVRRRARRSSKASAPLRLSDRTVSRLSQCHPRAIRRATSAPRADQACPVPEAYRSCSS